MSVQVYTAAANQLEARCVRLEVALGKGFAGISVIGKLGEIAKDGIERAGSSLAYYGCDLPARKILISVTPADLLKDGSHFDLAFAAAFLEIQEKSSTCSYDNFLFAAELSLTGEIRPVKNIVSFTLAGLEEGRAGIVCSRQNLTEIAQLADLNFAESFQVIGLSNIIELIDWQKNSKIPPGTLLSNLQPIDPQEYTDLETGSLNYDDMILSKQQELLALTIAGGGHNSFLLGHPGCGKSMFAERLPSVMPLMEKRTHVEALRIHSALRDSLGAGILRGQVSFRSPHHGASAAALLGGREEPGELALAHGGILFLDEFPEFRRDLLESLREPLQSGKVSLSRAAYKIEWRSDLILIAAANPCPCGWYLSTKKPCVCPSSKIQAYLRKISGPLLDRIDIHFRMEASESIVSDLFSAKHAKRTQNLREKVANIRQFSLNRNQNYGVTLNRDLKSADLKDATQMSEVKIRAGAKNLEARGCSIRSVAKLFRVARTLADISEREEVWEEDILQAASWQFASDI